MAGAHETLFVPSYKRAPFVAEAIAEDVLYAFAHGWLDLPKVVVGDEASERLTRLYLVRKFVCGERPWLTGRCK